MVKKRRDYKSEIIEILKTNNGKFTGFNRLCEEGNFHRGSLLNNLLDLEYSGQISFHKIASNSVTYQLENKDPRTKILDLFPELKRIPKLDYSDKNKIKKLVKLLLNLYSQLVILEYGWRCYSIQFRRMEFLQDAQKWLDSRIRYSQRHIGNSQEKEVFEELKMTNSIKKRLEIFNNVCKKYNIR